MFLNRPFLMWDVVEWVGVVWVWVWVWAWVWMHMV